MLTLVKAPKAPAGRKLDLGCGAKGEEGWVTFDITSALSPTVQGDAQMLPFADDAFAEIRCWHVLEHIPRARYVFHPEQRGAQFIPARIETRYGLVDVMNECWRVLMPGGAIDIEVPLFPTDDAIGDPTHVGFFVAKTFDYFTGADDLGTLAGLYGIKPWELIYKERVNHAKELVIQMRPVK